jgi:hypothetical protein
MEACKLWCNFNCIMDSIYSGTSHGGHLLNEDTSLIRTGSVGPNGVRNMEVPLHE